MDGPRWRPAPRFTGQPLRWPRAERPDCGTTVPTDLARIQNRDDPLGRIACPGESHCRMARSLQPRVGSSVETVGGRGRSVQDLGFLDVVELRIIGLQVGVPLGLYALLIGTAPAWRAFAVA